MNIKKYLSAVYKGNLQHLKWQNPVKMVYYCSYSEIIAFNDALSKNIIRFYEYCIWKKMFANIFIIWNDYISWTLLYQFQAWGHITQEVRKNEKEEQQPR